MNTKIFSLYCNIYVYNHKYITKYLLLHEDNEYEKSDSQLLKPDECLLLYNYEEFPLRNSGGIVLNIDSINKLSDILKFYLH